MTLILHKLPMGAFCHRFNCVLQNMSQLSFRVKRSTSYFEKEWKVYVMELWPHVHSIAPDCWEFLRRNESIASCRFFSQHGSRERRLDGRISCIFRDVNVIARLCLGNRIRVATPDREHGRLLRLLLKCDGNKTATDI